MKINNITQKDTSNYEVEDNAYTTCKRCGLRVEHAVVSHVLDVEGMPLALREVQYELVPYCPTCEPPPKYYGYPIRKPL